MQRWANQQRVVFVTVNVFSGLDSDTSKGRSRLQCWIPDALGWFDMPPSMSMWPWKTRFKPFPPAGFAWRGLNPHKRNFSATHTTAPFSPIPPLPSSISGFLLTQADLSSWLVHPNSLLTGSQNLRAVHQEKWGQAYCADHSDVLPSRLWTWTCVSQT